MLEMADEVEPEVPVVEVEPEVPVVEGGERRVLSLFRLLAMGMSCGRELAGGFDVRTVGVVSSAFEVEVGKDPVEPCG